MFGLSAGDPDAIDKMIAMCAGDEDDYGRATTNTCDDPTAVLRRPTMSDPRYP